jgi:uncharacterized protein (TIGR02145 family)
VEGFLKKQTMVTDNKILRAIYLVMVLVCGLIISAFSLTGNKKIFKKELKVEIKIGKQIWMTENLNVDKFNNGDPIQEAKTNKDWESAALNKQPAWCYYENDPANGAKYGKLYNWYAITDSRGLAPMGWRIPSDEDWDILTEYLGEDIAGKKMKSTTGWTKHGDKSGNGTNESGFNGLPGGIREDSGHFYSIGSEGYWWSSTEGRPWGLGLYNDLDSAGPFNDNKFSGYSVRCVR